MVKLIPSAVPVHFVSFLAGTSRMTPMYVRHRKLSMVDVQHIGFHSNGQLCTPTDSSASLQQSIVTGRCICLC